MKYSIVMCSANQLKGFADFATEQLNRHFAVWLLEDPCSTFSIKWIKNALVLRTDSSVLVEKWFTIEQQYLNNLLQTATVGVNNVSKLANAA